MQPEKCPVYLFLGYFKITVSRGQFVVAYIISRPIHMLFLYQFPIYYQGDCILINTLNIFDIRELDIICSTVKRLKKIKGHYTPTVQRECYFFHTLMFQCSYSQTDSVATFCGAAMLLSQSNMIQFYSHDFCCVSCMSAVPAACFLLCNVYISTTYDCFCSSFC